MTRRRVSSKKYASLVNQKKSGSCWCIFWKLRVGRRILWWRHLIHRWVLQRRASCRDSTSCPWISTEAEFFLVAWVILVLSYFLGCSSVGSLEETALLDLENQRCRVSPRRQGSPSIELSIKSAVSFLFNLGADNEEGACCFKMNKSYCSKVGKRGLLWTPN